MWPALVAVIIVGAQLPAARGFQDAQVAALRAIAADHQYFRYYCVSVNPGTLSPPFTREARIRSTASHPDPSSTVLDQLKDSPARFVRASECEQTKGDYDIIHGPTKRKPALLVVVGPVEIVSETDVRVTVFTTSGFLTETHALVELRRRDSQWEVVSSRILLQA